MEKLLMARDKRTAEAPITDVNEVINARNEAAYEAAKMWREASENQDAKARREAEAQVVAEKLALNAATPEGANANKLAIGGPLPKEQADFTTRGTTVQVDNNTLEQVVVDPQPEVIAVDGTVDDGEVTGKTHEQLKAMVDADTGTIPVGHETDGGSTGEAAVSTVAALGGTSDSKDAKAVTTPKSDTTVGKTTDSNKS